jgi:outer membrane protein, heavy metal efflux system
VHGPVRVSVRAELLRRVVVRLAGALLLVCAASRARAGEALPAIAGEPALGRARVVALVRQAPGARVARSETAVATAALNAAGELSLENPVFSGMGGLRFNADGTRPFNAVATLSWPVDLGGKRGARRHAAEAEQRAAAATGDDQERKLLLAALLQHALVLRDERALQIAVARHALAERVLAAAQRRHAAGGVPELDVALAAMQEKRDASAEASARGDHDAGMATLSALLGAAGDAEVSGTLVPEDDVPALAPLLKRVDQRPDLRAAGATVVAAQAKAERERTLAAPTLSLLAQYERDDGDNLGMLGLAVPLPILNANRLEIASSAAEVDAARARAAQARALAQGELKALHARYLATKTALETLAPTAALARRAVNLATRGYELGENDLAAVLLVRREAVEAEGALLEAESAHAAAKIELLVAAGKIPR